ncbi:hypothetical protein QPK32_23335 [Massilia sp. YIM B02763]|uniref:hypothetical protein n=1 Tax=Massilia sp. YIM B02763 TaxID=3050130 RepID=UPI0025B6C61E|nr:hypothetical protein [Massilia sp. YIM B02763]MDN4056004.1 hypothetical protein [Massilia sp. YIM B02763]
MVELGHAHTERFPRKILSLFFDWLSDTPIKDASKQSDMIIVRALIHWCARNVQDILDGPLAIESRNFFRQQPVIGPSLSEHDSRLVMNAALVEIEEVATRIRVGREELNEQATQRAKLIARLLEIGEGRIPVERIVATSKESLARRMRDEGGLKLLCRMIFPVPRDLLPFYVAIQFQLAGNPQAIAKLRRDCIEVNELREDREWVIWDKPRGAKAQRADFPAGKATSAPSLIRRLSELTQPLTSLNEATKDFVFLAYDRGRVAVPSLQTWHNSLLDFRHRHNLPEFTFAQLRRTSAVLHHQAAGSILIARQKLNHASVATTVRYSSYENVGDMHDRVVHSSQEELRKEIHSVPLRRLVRKEPVAPADTVFGFLCSDPFAGHVDQSSPEKPCDHFHRCATCPGALIPLDRPDVIAAILRSHKSLVETKERAIQQGWLPRFNALYQPTLDAISNDLLPKVPAHVIEAAESIAKIRPFPILE